MQQIKEQGKNLPDQTNEEETGSVPEKEYRVMIVKMMQNLGNRENTRKFNEDLEELKSKQGFPGGTVVKNPPANAGDTGSSPGPGRSHMPRSN